MSSNPVEVGTIWYHHIAGFSRPFIVRSIENGMTKSENLDDGGWIDYPLDELEAYLTAYPTFRG